MDLLQGYGSDSSSGDEDSGPSTLNVATAANNNPSSNHHGNDNSQLKFEIVSAENVSRNTFVRSVPHIPGNWAGHLYCPLPENDISWHKEMTESILRFQQLLQQQAVTEGHERSQIITQIPDIHSSANNNNSSVHVSMSRPFVLQLSSIESFVAKLNQRLQHLPTTTLRVHPKSERILVNDEKTRSFWTWPVDPNPTLLAILEEIDSVLQIYNLPVYYDPPLFHISLASVVGDLTTMSGSKKTSVIYVTQTSGEPFYMAVNQMHCTFGTTKYFKIDLLER